MVVGSWKTTFLLGFGNFSGAIFVKLQGGMYIIQVGEIFRLNWRILPFFWCCETARELGHTNDLAIYIGKA